MVSITTYCIKQQSLLYVLLLVTYPTTHANIFEDAFNAVKQAANKVDDAFTEAGKEIKKGFDTAGREIEKGANIAIGAIKERFSDTKTTRAIDYGIRKAALETALATANGVLEGSKQAATGTLIAAEETAKAGLSAAEHFLSDVVGVASPAILRGSATTAQGVLEGVKQAGVGVLQGSQWIVTQATNLIDINHVKYQGDLKRLKSGVLGDMLCEGTAFRKPFSFHFDLDPRDLSSIEQSIATLLKEFERLFNENITNPLVNAFTPLKQQVQQVEKIVTMTATAPNDAVKKAIEESKKATETIESITKKEQAAAGALKSAAGKLNLLAEQNMQVLADLIIKGVTNQSPETTRARQEFIRRLKTIPQAQRHNR
jgi:hypothetical protein